MKRLAALLALLGLLLGYTLVQARSTNSVVIDYNNNGTALLAGVVANSNGTPIPIGGVSTIAVTITGITTATVNFEATVDNTNWVGVPCQNASNPQNLVISTASSGTFQCGISGFDQFRTRVSGYSAGTITATAIAIVGGTGPTTVTGTAVVAQLPAAAALGDATANPTTTLIGVQNMVFNGSTWDRRRSSSVGTGIAVAAPPDYSYKYITATQDKFVVKNGAGFLRNICFNTVGTPPGTMTVFDNNFASGNIIALPAITGTAPACVGYDLAFNTGLTIQTAVANGPNMTVSYR